MLAKIVELHSNYAVFFLYLKFCLLKVLDNIFVINLFLVLTRYSFVPSLENPMVVSFVNTCAF